jgi:hypothetical protein
MSYCVTITRSSSPAPDPFDACVHTGTELVERARCDHDTGGMHTGMRESPSSEIAKSSSCL